MDMGQLPTAVLLQPKARFQWQIRHRGKIDRALVIGPFHDLPATKGLQTDLLKQGFKLAAVQTIEVALGGQGSVCPGYGSTRLLAIPAVVFQS